MAIWIPTSLMISSAASTMISWRQRRRRQRQRQRQRQYHRWCERSSLACMNFWLTDAVVPDDSFEHSVAPEMLFRLDFCLDWNVFSHFPFPVKGGVFLVSCATLHGLFHSDLEGVCQ